MNIKVNIFIRNLSYTLTSNLVALIVSFLVLIIVPKLIDVEEYGYWQLFMFYASYIGFLHFGWNDGIYLRYGGKEYRDLDKRLFNSQFYMLLIMQIVIAFIIIVFAPKISSNLNKIFIFYMVAVCMVIVNVRYMLLYILQATNRINDYARITLLDRVLFCLLIVVLLICGNRQYTLLIVADLFGKLASLVYAIYCCRDMVFCKTCFNLNVSEAVKNISVGIKLMFANIASMLIVGIVRLGIEQVWDISTFGRVSLSLSISNLMMLFINAVGIILFPILRRTNESKLPGIYSTMRTFLMTGLLGVLVLYYPLRVVLSSWLPQYTDSLMYMVLLFPMCVYEGKMALLINTYLKTLRKENFMLFINLVSVGLSIVLTTIFTILFNNLTLAILSIVLLLAFRSALAELFLARILGISIFKDIFLEILMSLLFMLTGWFIGSWLGVAVYAIAYVIYLLIKRKDIISTFTNIKMMANG